MDAILQLPEALAHRLQSLAAEEQTSLDGLLRRLVSEHVERRGVQPSNRSMPRRDVSFPLVSEDHTGVIHPVTGPDLDEMFALDDITS